MYCQTHFVWMMISKVYFFSNSLLWHFFTWWLLMVGKIYTYIRDKLSFWSSWNQTISFIANPLLRFDVPNGADWWQTYNVCIRKNCLTRQMVCHSSLATTEELMPSKPYSMIFTLYMRFKCSIWVVAPKTVTPFGLFLRQSWWFWFISICLLFFYTSSSK